ncbi:MAG TPA: alkyl hydroperoxide reductase, partial [Thermodesulfobacteriota bacterium]
MAALERLRDAIPEPAKDIRLNLQSVFQAGVLTPAQRWGVAAASAIAARNPDLRRAVLADARSEAGAAVVDDAMAAAALMAMNNVYYRF